MGPLIPEQPGTVPQFAQLYVLDSSEQQAAQRLVQFGNGQQRLQADIVQALQAMLHTCNPYVQDFKVAASYSDPHVPDLEWRIVEGKSHDRHVYNVPCTSEIAAFVLDAQVARSYNRDIVIHPHGGGV